MVLKTPLLVAVLSIAAILLLVALDLPPGHSAALNYAWSVQYSDATSWIAPFPRYLPGLWAGLGGHDFFFYAPLPFWFIAVFVDPLCVGCAPVTEFVIGNSLLLVASGFTMYAFLRSFFAASPAAFGACTYVILPYHLLIDWFERQAAGEFTAYVFIPLVALGMEQIRRQAAGGLFLSLGVAGTALSHLPTALLAGHVFAVLVLVFVASQRGGPAARMGLLARYLCFGLLGLALPAFYWLPAVMLMDTVSPGALYDPYFSAWRWLYGQAEPHPNSAFAFRIAVAFLACLPVLVGACRTARGGLLAWIAVPATVAVLLNLAPSEPLWRAWIILKVQFPWRLMTLVDFASGIAAAALAAVAKSRLDRVFLALALMVFVTGSAFLAATVQLASPDSSPERQYRDWLAAAEYLSPQMTETLRTRLGKPVLGHFDQGAIADTIALLVAEFETVHGTAVVIDRRSRSLTVEAPQGAAVLSLPVQYWEPWQAQTVTGAALATRPNPRFGTLDILAPANGFDNAPVTVFLPWQPSEWAGAAVSLLALLLLMAMLPGPRRLWSCGASPGPRPGPH